VVVAGGAVGAAGWHSQQEVFGLEH
jgi:hypothetical protein